MSVMAKHTTHGTWVIGSNILLITWWFRIGIVLLLLRRGSRRLILVLPITVRFTPIALIVIGGSIVSIPALLILRIKLDNIYPNLVGWLRWCFFLWGKSLMI